MMGATAVPEAGVVALAAEVELATWMELEIGANILTVEFAGVQPALVRLCRNEAMRVWAGCRPVAHDRNERRVDVRCVSAYTRTLHERDLAVRALLSDLSRDVTRVLVERLASSHLLLHAAALPLPGGLHCSAYVGASGAGKSTFALAHGQDGYLTDELVAVDRGGMVLPYRKPLSIVVGGLVKDQRAPTAPEVGPRLLDALIILDRVETGEVTATRLDMVDSIAALIPHTSSLATLPRPLHRLAQLVADCGGAILLRYREADQVDLNAVLAHCQKRILQWAEPTDDVDVGHAGSPSGAIVRTECADAIEADGNLTVLTGGRLLRLTPLAGAVWRRCGTATTTEAIALDIGVASLAVREVASELADHGLLRRTGHN